MLKQQKEGLVLMRAVVARLTQRQLSIGFKSWNSAVREYNEMLKQQKEGLVLMRSVVARMMQRQLSIAFKSWWTIITGERQHERKQTLAMRMLARWRKMLLAMPWRSWCDAVAAHHELLRQQEKAITIMRTAVTQMIQKMLAVGLRTWQIGVFNEKQRKASQARSI